MIIIVATIGLLLVLRVLSKKPSHNRNWEIGQDKLSKVIINKREIIIENFRDFAWQKESKNLNIYKTEKFYLDKITGIDVIISRFSRFKGLAHILLDFKFLDNKNLVVSLESRREVRESFSPIGGLFRKFEVIYVVGSEEDIIGLREKVRKERVDIYSTVINPKEAKEIFLSLARDINDIYNQPAFYNSLFNNCNKVITKNIAKILEIKFPFNYKMIFPGFMDKVLMELKLIKDEKSPNDL